MEKLLQLLNEHERSLGSDREWLGIIDEDGLFCTRKSQRGNLIIQHSSEYEAISQIISKKFGFIQWLVEKNKIKDPLPQVLKDIDVVGNDTITGVDVYSTTDSLIMLLAIQEDSISFLVSILK